MFSKVGNSSEQYGSIIRLLRLSSAVPAQKNMQTARWPRCTHTLSAAYAGERAVYSDTLMRSRLTSLRSKSATASTALTQISAMGRFSLPTLCSRTQQLSAIGKQQPDGGAARLQLGAKTVTVCTTLQTTDTLSPGPVQCILLSGWIVINVSVSVSK